MQRLKVADRGMDAPHGHVISPIPLKIVSISTFLVSSLLPFLARLSSFNNTYGSRKHRRRLVLTHVELFTSLIALHFQPSFFRYIFLAKTSFHCRTCAFRPHQDRLTSYKSDGRNFSSLGISTNKQLQAIAQQVASLP